MIGTPSLLMVSCENRNLIAAISLLGGRIPLDIILTTRFSPNWDLDRLDGLRTFDIGNNHIKTALAQVLVTDLHGSRRRCEQGGCCSGYALGWCILVLIVEMNMVVAASIFMVGFIDRNLIGTICLSGSCIPSDIILTSLTGPNRDHDRLDSLRTRDLLDENIKGSRRWIEILNTDFSTSSKTSSCSSNPDALSTCVFIVEVNMVNARTILMILPVNGHLIATICLLGGRIPAKVILTIFLSPNR